MLAKELGEEKAIVFLNAHEVDSTQTKKEKDMDLFNNEIGLKYFRENKSTPMELKQIERVGLEMLKAKQLKVLKPRYKEIPGGYYSK